ncbi:hypothetical protein E4U53_001696, partial [Claviceps sorghi]
MSGRLMSSLPDDIDDIFTTIAPWHSAVSRPLSAHREAVWGLLPSRCPQPHTSTWLACASASAPAPAFDPFGTTKFLVHTATMASFD